MLGIPHPLLEVFLMSHFEIEITDMKNAHPAALESWDLLSESSQSALMSIEQADGLRRSSTTDTLIKDGILPQFEISYDDVNLNGRKDASSNTEPKGNPPQIDMFGRLEEGLGLDSTQTNKNNAYDRTHADDINQRTVDSFSALEKELGLQIEGDPLEQSDQPNESVSPADPFKRLEDELGLSK